MRGYIFAAAAMLAAFPAQADDCGTILNAMLAQTATPYSATVTITGPGVASEVAKSVYTGTKFYTQAQGQWHVMTLDAKQEQAMIRDAEKAAHETCRKQGNEMLNGKSATVYTSHVVAPGSTSDNKVWLGGTRVLKTDVQIQGGPHIVTVYDYAHVSAPANATPMQPPPQH